jgi:hypothetical protein
VSGEEVDRFRSVVQRVLNEFVGDGSDVHLTVVSREDESTTSTSEERPEPLEQEGSDSPEQEEEPEVSASEAESSSDDVESFSEPPSDEEGDEADGDDPFEKDLARRVIEDF